MQKLLCVVFVTINSIDTERKVALTDLNVSVAVFIKNVTIGTTEKTRQIGINEFAAGGYGDCPERADCAGCTDGTQAANCPDGDGFS